MPKFEQRIVEKPWGRELIFAQTDSYVGKEILIKAGELLSRQYHRKKDETVYVVRGPLILEVGMDPIEKITLQQGESYHIPPGTIHRYIAPEDSDCVLIEVSTTELDDVVRLEDRYGRVS